MRKKHKRAIERLNARVYTLETLLTKMLVGDQPLDPSQMTREEYESLYPPSKPCNCPRCKTMRESAN